jgi:hypothetical protein
MTQNASSPKWPRYLRRAEAARYLREVWGLPCATRTLAKIACVSSDGPAMHYAGRIPLYTLRSLDQYAVGKIGPARRSTFGPGETAPVAHKLRPNHFTGPESVRRSGRGDRGGAAS